MPHFGLIDEKLLDTAEGLLMRAKLHSRCGMRRIREGKYVYGILTLYDALISGMQWYVALPRNRKNLGIEEGANLNDDRNVIELLRNAGVIDKSFDFESFDMLVESALKESIADFSPEDTMADFESFMIKLGIMPFDENELPPEDPSTF